jgi:hypothetical protein
LIPTTVACCLLSSVLRLILHAFFIHPMRTACPVHAIFIGVMTVAIWEAAKIVQIVLLLPS